MINSELIVVYTLLLGTFLGLVFSMAYALYKGIYKVNAPGKYEILLVQEEVKDRLKKSINIQTV